MQTRVEHRFVVADDDCTCVTEFIDGVSLHSSGNAGTSFSVEMPPTEKSIRIIRDLLHRLESVRTAALAQQKRAAAEPAAVSA